MASTTSSNSGVHSESASSRSQPPVKGEQDVSSENVDKLKKESVEGPFEDMNKKKEKEKYEKYAADYTRYLKAKYFSDKTLFGGNIYDVKMSSEDGQTVKASRLAPYQSFADPANFHALVTSVSKSEEETTAEASNGNQTTKTTAEASNGKQTTKKSN